MSDLITLIEAAKLLPPKGGKPINANQLWRWVQRGKLRGKKIGRVWMVSRADVLRFAAGGRGG